MKNMKRIKQRFGLAGRYRLDVGKLDANGKMIPRVATPWFNNLITDAGLDHIGNTSASYLAECRVGSGNTAPANGDTGLVAQVATTTNITQSGAAAQPSATYYISRTNVYRFAAGDAEGNLAEVGIGPSSAGDLFSRALILDGLGDPTTITVLADEVLDVTYELRLYPDTSDVTGTRTIAGDDYDYVLRVAEVTSTSIYWANSQSGVGVGGDRCIVYDGAIGAVTASPGGTSDQTFTNTPAGYTPGSYTRNIVYTFGLDNGNFGGGISAALFTNGGVGAVQVSFDPPIPKDNTKSLTLEVQFIWERAVI